MMFDFPVCIYEYLSIVALFGDAVSLLKLQRAERHND